MKRFFKLWLPGNTDDKSLAIVSTPPMGLGVYEYYMSRGKHIGEHYPQDARVYLDKREPGIKLASVLGNTVNYFIVNTALKDLILNVCQCEIETLSFTLYNHKKRVHSKDYWIINPIGTFDCLKHEASKVLYLDDTKRQITGISLLPGSVVFDAGKIDNAPEIFRIPEKPAWIFIGLNLAKAIKEHQFTNVILREEIKLV